MGGEERDTWSAFLRELTDREGWSVSRLARQAGIDRSHIHRMMRGETKTVTVDTVRMIAKGGQVPLDLAMKAARGRTEVEPPTADDDWEAKRIRESNLSDEKKRDLLAHLARRRQQLREEIDLLLGE